MRHVIALARALVLQPRILLLDEPLSNLDAQLRLRMREEVSSIQQRVGITTVFVTHDQEEALAAGSPIDITITRYQLYEDGILRATSA